MGVTLQQREWTGEFLHPFALDVDHREDIFVSPKMAWLVLRPETQETVVSSGRKNTAPQKTDLKLPKLTKRLHRYVYKDFFINVLALPPEITTPPPSEVTTVTSDSVSMPIQIHNFIHLLNLINSGYPHLCHLWSAQAYRQVVPRHR